MTEAEVQKVHSTGHSSPVRISEGWAVLVPCANSDWEIDTLPSYGEAVECGRYYWGDSFGDKSLNEGAKQ